MHLLSFPLLQFPKEFVLAPFHPPSEAREACPPSILMTVPAASRRSVPACRRWAANVRMRHSGPVSVWRRMAILTRERLIVRRNQVAVGAHRAMVGNTERAVSKSRPQPARGDPRSVAGQASGRVQRGNVVRYCAAERHGALPSDLVAAVAIRVRDCKTEWIGTHVARSAGGGHVRTLQRPARRAVIELASRPEHRIVAGRAL
jgi:hypothetical protein